MPVPAPALRHVLRSTLALLCGGTALAGCSSGPPVPRQGLTSPGHAAAPSPGRPASSDGEPRRLEGDRIPKGGGTYKVGAPYQIAGRWYAPRDEPGYDRTGTGSWYGKDFHGKRTANGEIYDMHALTAAHPTLPLPSYLYVSNVANGRTVLVRLNDRGPYVDGRLIDLSFAAAKALGYADQGLGHVRVRYAGRAPLDGNDSAERRHLASQPWAADDADVRFRQSSLPRSAQVGAAPLAAGRRQETSAR